VRRIVRATEPVQPKVHWDYVLEEMQWLSADFAQERKFKRATTRKVARLVTRHFQVCCFTYIIIFNIVCFQRFKTVINNFYVEFKYRL